MTKNDFKRKFPEAAYSGRSKTFYLPADQYGAAVKFVQHKFAPFKIQKQEE